jgi:hypothetical protein
MLGIPCNQVLAIVRIRQWAFDRQALKTAKTTDYQRTGWTQRNNRSADARIELATTRPEALKAVRTDSAHSLLSARRLIRNMVAASMTPSNAPNGTSAMAHKIIPIPSPGAQQFGPAAAVMIMSLANNPAKAPDTLQTA